MELPAEYTKLMKLILGREYPAYLEALYRPRLYGLRVNTHKISVEAVEKSSRCKDILSKIPFVENGFYYPADAAPSGHPAHAAGLYYLQEPSAMLPASCLDIAPGDRVLDLCAAPGGKATQLGAKLRGSGCLVANDLSASRARGLLRNLERCGIYNCLVTAEDPVSLAGRYAGCFDKILVDAPCSGEGMFRKDPSLIRGWSERGPKYYSSLQKEITGAAVSMLRPGGMLLYSTCTFSPEENEAVVLHMLKQDPELRILEIPKREGLTPGRPDLIQGGPEELTGCARVYPHRAGGEGHFLALLKKGHERCTAENQSQTQNMKRPASGFERLSGTEQECLYNFFKALRTEGPLMLYGGVPLEGDRDAFLKKDGNVYWMPGAILYRKGLRYLRTGLLAGVLKNGRFEPSQALALALDGTRCVRVSFEEGDERILRYLKGETVFAGDLLHGPLKGCVLVCLGDYGLGWAKPMKDQLKNKYAAGWRWQ